MPGYPASYGTLPIGAAPYAAPAAAVPAAMLLLSPKDSDAATIAAGSQVASLPVANLQAMQPKKVWRSASASDYLNITFATPIAANMLALVGHNLSSMGVYRVRLAATLAATVSAPVVDTGYQSVWPATGKPVAEYWPRRLSVLTWSNNAECLCARVDIADPDPVNTYVEAGRLVLGRYWQPTTNFDIAGVPLGFDQIDIQTRTDYGEIFTDRRQRSAARRMSVQISAADKRETLDGVAEIQRLRGGHGDVIAVLDPNATTDFHRFSMQGVFTAPQEHQIVPQFSGGDVMFSVSFPIREVI